MLYAAAGREKEEKKKKIKKGFIWMVATSASICSLPAVKSLHQKLRVWDPSRDDPLAALRLPLSPFVY